MKVLFVPYSETLSHVIPLLALDRKLQGSSIETAFLAPRKSHALLQQAGAAVLKIDHNGQFTGIRTELEAYGVFRPDVVVDDASISTGYAVALTGKARATIQRTGVFPGGEPRNPAHKHSLGWLSNDPASLPDVSYLGLPKLKNAADLFNAEVKIVPGVRSVEVLPRPIEHDPSYYFAGPLLADDFLVRQLIPGTGGQPLKELQNFEALDAFWELHRGRKAIYLTFGNVAKAAAPLLDCVRRLLDRRIPMVSSVPIDDLSDEQKAFYYYAPYLPMHYVCSRVDLMIHQCGSGTYQYPIMHAVPAITIGTRCFDREDVALRLEELGVSSHLPSPAETPDFSDRLMRLVDRYFHDEQVLQDAGRRLTELKREMERTTAAFRLEEALATAINSNRQKRRDVAKSGRAISGVIDRR